MRGYAPLSPKEGRDAGGVGAPVGAHGPSTQAFAAWPGVRPERGLTAPAAWKRKTRLQKSPVECFRITPGSPLIPYS